MPQTASLNVLSPISTDESKKKSSPSADHFGFNPMELVARVGAVLVGAQDNHVPGAGLRPAPGQDGDAVAEVEVVERAHVGHAQSDRQRNSKAQVHKNHKPATKSQVKTVMNTSWPKSEKARLEESISRMKKRSDPTAKKILKGLLRKKRGLKPANKRGPNQAVYVARYKAKLQGLPLPPLPSAA